jgi:hypothetical protein
MIQIKSTKVRKENYTVLFDSEGSNLFYVSDSGQVFDEEFCEVTNKQAKLVSDFVSAWLEEQREMVNDPAAYC